MDRGLPRLPHLLDGHTLGRFESLIQCRRLGPRTHTPKKKKTEMEMEMQCRESRIGKTVMMAVFVRG
jgi:hypothetical protein